MQNIEFDKRKSGIPLVGNLSWGTHFCHFYETKKDLLDILLPYFRTGLKNNEFCVWVTCAPLKPSDIKAALKIAVPNFHKYKHSGQIEIISCKGRSKSKQASCALIATKLNKVVSKNFDGLRFACCVSPGRNTKTGFSCYNVDSIAGYNALAAFSYPRKNFDALGLMQVVKKHHFALVRNAARWELLESSEATMVKDALKKSEEKRRLIFSNMSEGFAYSRIVLDDQGKPFDLVLLEVNRAFQRLTGLKPRKIIGKRVTKVLPGIENDPAGWIDKFGQVAITGQPAHFENYAQALKKWYSVSVFSPQKGFFAVIFSDITALRESHEKLAAVNEELSASNEELSASNEELRAETEERQKTEEILRNSQRAALNLMEDANAAFLQTEKANLELQREVAERKRAEDTLRESEQRLKRSQEIAHLGSWELDVENNRLSWSDEVYRIFGLKPQEFIATYEAFLERVHPEDRKAVDAAYSGSLREGKDSYEIEHRVVRKSTGEIRYVHEKCEHIRDASGKIIRSAGMVQDISERRLAEQALKQSEELLSLSQEAAGAGSWSWDILNNKLNWSKEYYELCGLSPQKVKPTFKNLIKHIYPDDRSKVRREVEAALRRRRRRRRREILLDIEFRINHPQKALRWLNAKGEIYCDKSGKPLRLTGIALDITERKRAEEKIKHLASFPQHNPNPIIEISANGKVVFSNVSAIKALERLGVPKKTSLFLPEDFPRILKDLHLNKQTLYTHEIKIKNSTFVETLTVLPELKVVRIYARDITQRKIAEGALKEAHDTLELKVAKRTEELAEANRRLIKEIVERKEIERAVRLRGAVLKLMQRSVSRLEFLNTLVKFIKGLSGCRYCGIRVLNEEGEIPYEAYLGFSRSFWEKENWLSISHDQCACIRVVTGNALPQDKPCMSSGGSFVANDALGFFHSLNPEEKKLFRGVCMQDGFHSLAVIPVSYKNEVIAAIHLADERKDILSKQKIGFLELLSPLIGEGIHKFDMEERIRQSHIGQSIISSLLRYSFTEISLEKIFIRCLELLFSMSWLSTESKGGIYLAADEQDILVLKAEKNLPDLVKKECAKIPHGKCYCGKAARDKKIYFASTIDKDHEVTYAGMKPHGHYCVPILSGERLLGVINLYLPEKYRRDIRKEEFLMAVSSALSGIIQRRQAEDEVIKSNARIANILEGITDGFIALNSDWRFTYVNAAGETIMGVKRQEVLGKIVWDVFPEAKKTRVYEEFHSSVMNKLPVSLEVLDPRTNKWIEIHAYPSGEGLSAYFKDISEQKAGEEKLKETQDQLEQASRLSDIGTLAATVAHELRNPLAAIQMASYNIKRKAQNPLLDKHLLTIENKVNESEQIISNLLFYSRLRLPRHENIKIYENIQECIGLVKRRFVKEKISLDVDLKAIKKISMEADPLQIKEVFCNILNNAYECQAKDLKRVKIKAEIENESVKFVIKDSGEGINKHDLERVFDPFFTTKARGTGLGLTVCKQVINLHGGSINIDSEKDIGTAVTVRLPIKKESAQ